MKKVKKLINLYKQEGARVAGTKFVHKVIYKALNFKKKRNSRISYNKWFNKFSVTRLQLSKQRKYYFNIRPLISIIVPTYNTPIFFLIQMVNSVINQSYENWELCIADASTDQKVANILGKFCNNESRIKVTKLNANLMISENTNWAIKLAKGEYIGFLDHDDMLSPNCLYEFVKAINQHNLPELLYSDEDVIDAKNTHLRPHLKPDWSPHLLLSYNYITHFLMIRKDVLDKVGKLRSEMDGAQDYDLVLRVSQISEKIVHIPQVLYHWRESDQSTVSNASSKPYADGAGLAVVKHYMSKQNKIINYEVANGEQLFTYRLLRKLESSVMVSIIIPTKDAIDYLKSCVESILNLSTYVNYEIIILDNNSEEFETKLWFSQIINNQKVRIVEAHYSFNWSRLNNHGISVARGDVFIFLNNDTRIITPNWMEELASYALDVDVGVVGALLLYEDETIQHAGVVVGIGGFADHIFKGDNPVHYPSPFVSSMVLRDVLAVTGACMVISRTTIDKIGGFNQDFIICGSDVEICLRAYQNGLYNVYNPYVKLYHYESKTRSTYIPEMDFVLSKQFYSPYLKDGDPFYNPNLDYKSAMVKLKD